MNSKYIKTKRNRKLEAKFFGPFRVLHPVGKQAYKLELPKNWRIYDVFHVSLLEQDITKKGRVDETTSRLEFKNEGDNEYEIEAIHDSLVYASKLEGHLPGLYYLVSWKGYPEEKKTWEPTSAVLHLRKLISTFPRDHPDKPTATSPPIDSALPMTRPTIRPEASSTKQKRGRPAKANSTSKRAKKS